MPDDEPKKKHAYHLPEPDPTSEMGHVRRRLHDNSEELGTIKLVTREHGLILGEIKTEVDQLLLSINGDGTKEHHGLVRDVEDIQDWRRAKDESAKMIRGFAWKVGSAVVLSVLSAFGASAVYQYHQFQQVLQENKQTQRQVQQLPGGEPPPPVKP